MGSIKIVNCARSVVLKSLKKVVVNNLIIVKYLMESTSVFFAKSNISLIGKATALKSRRKYSTVRFISL